MPYLMSSHPGSTLEDAIELALCLKRDKYAPEQVQDYYPTPGTASTVMYYTGINPLDMKPVHVVTDYHEKQLQRALLQYNRPDNAPLVREALRLAGREDLIGYGEECLVRPERQGTQNAPASKGKGGASGRAAEERKTRTAQSGKNTRRDGTKTASKSVKNSPKSKNNTKKPQQSAAKPKYAQIKRKNKA